MPGGPFNRGGSHDVVCEKHFRELHQFSVHMSEIDPLRIAHQEIFLAARRRLHAQLAALESSPAAAGD